MAKIKIRFKKQPKTSIRLAGLYLQHLKCDSVQVLTLALESHCMLPFHLLELGS